MKVADLAARRKTAECAKYAAMALDAFEKLGPGEKEKKVQRIGKPSTLDTDAETRRKAKAAL